MRLWPCLALIVYKLVSVLTLIADDIVPMFRIDSLQACVRVDILTYEIVTVFGIDSLQACVHVDINS